MILPGKMRRTGTEFKESLRVGAEAFKGVPAGLQLLPLRIIMIQTFLLAAGGTCPCHHRRVSDENTVRKSFSQIFGGIMGLNLP